MRRDSDNPGERNAFRGTSCTSHTAFFFGVYQPQHNMNADDIETDLRRTPKQLDLTDLSLSFFLFPGRPDTDGALVARLSD